MTTKAFPNLEFAGKLNSFKLFDRAVESIFIIQLFKLYYKASLFENDRFKEEDGQLWINKFLEQITIKDY